MAISISHGVPSTRSGATITNLGQHLAHALSGSEWREIKYLFDGRLDLPASIPPAHARRTGNLLDKAAAHCSMDPAWAEFATLLAGAAQRAAAAGQNWEWT